MSYERGTIHAPRPVTERVMAAVATITEAEFTIGDVWRLIPDIRRHIVGCIIIDKSRSGILIRLAPNRYGKGSLRAQRKILPMGLVAEATWAALATTPNKTPMRLTEVVREAESYIGRQDARIYYSISGVSRARSPDGTSMAIWNEPGRPVSMPTPSRQAYLSDH